MKLLLTSDGISNESIAKALRKLTKRKIKIAFIPTAANIEIGEKDWLIDDLNNCQKMGTVDIVDISAVPKSNWLPRLKKSNAIVVGGGDSSYLMNCIISSGLKNEISKLLKNRVYVGISAGSIVTSKTLQASSDFIYSEGAKHAPEGLGFVEFNIRPHLNSPKFPKVRDKYLRKLVRKLHGDVYAIDDDSAVMIDGNKIEVVSEGKWKKYSGEKKNQS